MRSIIDLLRREPRARLFFAAHAQSSLGTGAAYVALLLLAYDRLHSPWAISLVLFADFLPAMFLGPLLGAAVDRWPRRTCAVAADLLRACAFIALGLAGGFWLTLALALLAGVGTGISRPAVMAGLPSLVSPQRLPAATSLYGTLADAGFTLGPVLAAVGLIAAGPETVMVVNGLTFAVSAAVMARVPFGRAPPSERRAGRRSLVSDAREGIGEIGRMPGVRAILIGSSTILLFAGLFNVGELLLAREELGAGDAGFSILVAVFGVGVAAGSLRGAAGGTVAHMKHRYLWGLAVTGAGFLAAGLAPSFAFAAAAFALAGLGNGMVLVYERLLLQRAVPDSLMGRVFGVKEAAASWGWAVAFVGAGVLFSVVGTRELLGAAGIGAIAVALLSAWFLRGVWLEDGEPAASPLPELVERLEDAEPALVVPA